MMLFNIRTDESHVGFIAAVNRCLDSEPGNPYLVRYGHVCSERWWMAFDKGELAVVVLSGKVTHVGMRREEWTNEAEDIIEFDVNGQNISYDREGTWATAPIRVGDCVTVTRTIIELQTRSGPNTILIDLKCEWVPPSTE